MKALTSTIEFELPSWVDGFVRHWESPLDSISQRMDLAIALSAENVEQQTGGPFAAIVVDENDGKLVSVGMNLVLESGLSLAHAEMVALSLAQRSIGGWSLRKVGRFQLLTSCEPCAMCFGAIPWSGIRSLVFAAKKKDAEAAGFDEGDKPDHWVRSLQKRGIVVQSSVKRAAAAAVLASYKEQGGVIYNAVGHEKP